MHFVDNPANHIMTEKRIFNALKNFAAEVTCKSSKIISGEEEEQLRNPFDTLIGEIGSFWGMEIVCVGETKLAGRLGKPDFAVLNKGLLCGYVELKAPNKSVRSNRLWGHDRDQFKRFSHLPNVLYTSGNEWTAYNFGENGNKIHKLSGEIQYDGAKAVTKDSASAIGKILRKFLSYEPIIPTNANGKVDFQEFATQLAPLCKFLRDDVSEALSNDNSPLSRIATGWRQLLFPNASDDQFADAYAQTVVFALLMARIEGAGDEKLGEPLTFANAREALRAEHSLLSAALEALIDDEVRKELGAGLDVILRLIGAMPTTAFDDESDPWLYFYEDFLAEYDPKLRKDTGVYYTPIEVVRAQVRLVDHLLKNQLKKSDGFANPDVVTLDPATGTGTYLLGIIEHSLQHIKDRYGGGFVSGKASELAENLYGFELMVGPYAVADLRVSNALLGRNAKLPEDGARIFLTDTLESPEHKPQQANFHIERVLAKQQESALQVKRAVKVLVCIGNPPYDRVAAEDSAGGWVRYGEEGTDDTPILNDFTEPAINAGFGIDLKNLYNLYIFFWRWALWKVFEQQNKAGQGIVSFITASSYLDGKAFVGMREHLRRICDEIWIVDLGGDSRGTRKSKNVFKIQTPVAIAIACQSKRKATGEPSKVHYARIDGTRDEKLATLEAITNFEQVAWVECPREWQAPFLPAGQGEYFNWPLLSDLMPWQHSGVQVKRLWPFGPDESTLNRRWQALLVADNRALAFREDRDQKINRSYKHTLSGGHENKPISELPNGAMISPIRRYAYRFLDRQFIIADRRLISFPRPSLWRAHSKQQIYFSTLTAHPLGSGPALAATSDLPDLCHFRGSFGAKDTIPLYRVADTSKANIMPDLLEKLSTVYGRAVSPEDFAAYLYGVLAQPTFTEKYYDELESKELRVPLTKETELFNRISEIGKRLLWLHTYGANYNPKKLQHGEIPSGKARCILSVPSDEENYPEKFSYDEDTQTINVGKGKFAPVIKEVYEFDVSGLKVVQSWLGYRMKIPKGRKSSPLDYINPTSWTTNFTKEFLELLWVLEATLAIYPEQEELFNDVISSDLFCADELPEVPNSMRKEPPAPRLIQRLV